MKFRIGVNSEGTVIMECDQAFAGGMMGALDSLLPSETRMGTLGALSYGLIEVLNNRGEFRWPSKEN